MTSLFGLWGTSRAAAPAKARRRTTPPSYFRPSLEGLENRVVPAAPLLSPPSLGAALFADVHPGHHHNNGAVALPLSITGVSIQNGQLVATAALGNTSTSVPLDLSLATASQGTAAAAVTTPILHLTLSPIELDLLGLDVATGNICLNITATSGRGNLLGNLLTGIANLLNQPGATLGGVLGGLTSAQLGTLTTGLTNLLNGALRDVLTQGTASPSASEPEPPGHTDTANTCEILNLSLGPVNLSLLGLNVSLDDCNGGPVIVDVDAIPSSDPGGGLLGDLLCGVSNLLNNTGTPGLQGQLRHLVRDINHVIHDIEGLI